MFLFVSILYLFLVCFRNKEIKLGITKEDKNKKSRRKKRRRKPKGHKY
jgi:hypothetical protein